MAQKENGRALVQIVAYLIDSAAAAYVLSIQEYPKMRSSRLKTLFEQ